MLETKPKTSTRYSQLINCENPVEHGFVPSWYDIDQASITFYNKLEKHSVLLTHGEKKRASSKREEFTDFSDFVANQQVLFNWAISVGGASSLFGKKTVGNLLDKVHEFEPTPPIRETWG